MLSAVVIAVVGVAAMNPETARAAGVVVEHRAFGTTNLTTPEGDDQT